MILTDEQQVSMAVAFKTAAGNDATVDGDPTWTSSDESVITIAVDGTNAMKATAVSTGQIGTAQVSVVADADLGEGVREVTGILDIEVKSAEAVSASIAAGTPELRSSGTN